MEIALCFRIEKHKSYSTVSTVGTGIVLIIIFSVPVPVGTVPYRYCRSAFKFCGDPDPILECNVGSGSGIKK